MSFATTPPLFTPRQEEEEWMSSTRGEIEDVKSDLYGLSPSFASLGLVPDDSVAVSLSELRTELDRIPDSEKTTYLEACRLCPELIDRNHREAFLWRHGLDAKLAAWRMVRYWEHRQVIFGHERCFLPLTIKNMKDDVPALSMGILQLLPVKDDAGRSILFFDRSAIDFSHSSVKSVLRALWYVLHVAYNNPINQEMGVVFLQNANRSSFFPSLMQGMAEIATVVPLKFCSFHLCRPHALFHIVGPFLKFIIKKELRLRTQLHFGSDEVTLERLSLFGLTKDKVPSVLGGELVCDYKKWLLDRCKEEGKKDIGKNSQTDEHQLSLQQTCQSNIIDAEAFAFTQNPEGAKVVNNMQSNCSMAQVVHSINSNQNIPLASTNPFYQREIEPTVNPVEKQQAAEKQRAAMRQDSRQKALSLSEGVIFQHTLAAFAHGIESQASNTITHHFYPFQHMEPINLLNLQHAKSPPSTPSSHLIAHSGVTGQNKNTEAFSSKSLGSLPSLPPSSRFGDPRMNRAVVAKIENPHLTYLEALTIGGFKFTGTIKGLSGKTDKQILDDENISLSQRKNQLARRLRVLKKSAMA